MSTKIIKFINNYKSGPTYTSLSVEKDKSKISFNYITGPYLQVGRVMVSLIENSDIKSLIKSYLESRDNSEINRRFIIYNAGSTDKLYNTDLKGAYYDLAKSKNTLKWIMDVNSVFIPCNIQNDFLLPNRFRDGNNDKTKSIIDLTVEEFVTLFNFLDIADYYQNQDFIQYCKSSNIQIRELYGSDYYNEYSEYKNGQADIVISDELMHYISNNNTIKNIL